MLLTWTRKLGGWNELVSNILRSQQNEQSCNVDKWRCGKLDSSHANVERVGRVVSIYFNIFVYFDFIFKF